jgi:chitin synthase
MVAHIGDAVDFYTLLLVTCYSEGEESLRTTLDSLAATTYRDDRKLLFVVADGIVTGSGNTKSTPDLLLDLLDIEEARQCGFGPRLCNYSSVGIGARSINRASVYAGWYTYQGHRVPTILVVKCGMESERDLPKPGNRGKV